MTLVVLWAVGRHVLRTWDDLRASEQIAPFRAGWLIGSGLLYLAGLVGLRPVLRAHPAIEPDAGRLVPGIAGLPGEPPGQVRSRQGDGGGRPRWHGGSLRGAGVDRGDRHVLRNAGHDGRGRPDRGGRFRMAGGLGRDQVIDLKLPLWGRCRASASTGLPPWAGWAGAGAFSSGRTAGVRPAGGTGQPADPGRGPEAMPRFTAGSGSGSLLVVVRLDLAGLEPARGRARV